MLKRKKFTFSSSTTLIPPFHPTIPDLFPQGQFETEPIHGCQGCRGQRLGKDDNPIQVPPKDRPGGDSDNSTQKSWWPDNDAVLTKLGHRGDGEAHQTL